MVAPFFFSSQERCIRSLAPNPIGVLFGEAQRIAVLAEPEIAAACTEGNRQSAGQDIQAGF